MLTQKRPAQKPTKGPRGKSNEDTKEQRLMTSYIIIHIDDSGSFWILDSKLFICPLSLTLIAQCLLKKKKCCVLTGDFQFSQAMQIFQFVWVCDPNQLPTEWSCLPFNPYQCNRICCCGDSLTKQPSMGRGKKDRKIVEQVPPLYRTGGQEGSYSLRVQG